MHAWYGTDIHILPSTEESHTSLEQHECEYIMKDLSFLREDNKIPASKRKVPISFSQRTSHEQSPLALKHLSPSEFVYLIHGSLVKLICQKPHTTTGRQTCFSPVLSLLRQAFICLGISHYCRCWGGRKWRWRFSGGR